MGAIRTEQPLDDEIQGPAIITPLHVQDRETSTVAGAPRAWRKLHMLEHAYQCLRLGDKDSQQARDRLAAGLFYARLWDRARSPGRDSTQAIDFSGGGHGLPLTEAQSDAIRRLIAIEMRLGRNDRTIIRCVCALGHSFAESITTASLGKDTRVTSRVCEALDSLIDAIECTAKRNRK